MNRVVLAGGSGLIGTTLVPALRHHGYEPLILTRGPSRDHHAHWDARTPTGPWVEQLEGAHALINLVGRSVDCRKTPANKATILHSRVDSVHALAVAVAQLRHPPRVWIQTSTAHIYGDTNDEILDDASPTGAGFAPDVGRAWEAALNDAPLPEGTRRVILRISFVLARNGGALATLARLARYGLGGTTGTGRQYISWIHIADLTNIILRALRDPTMAGPYVVTAPEPVPNAVFMRTLRKAVHRPWSPPVPAPLVRLGSLLLRTDPELALLGRRCLPTRLLKEGFTFQHPTLPEALADLLAVKNPTP